jgi:hypothetical protein
MGRRTRGPRNRRYTGERKGLVVLSRALNEARSASHARAADDGTPAINRRTRLFGLLLPVLTMFAIAVAMPATAAAAGPDSISGTVTAASGGAGLPATVTLYNSDSDYAVVSTTLASSSGDYSFTGLNDGYYYVGFSDSGYQTQYSTDKTFLTNANYICVGASESCSDTATADAALAAGGGTISGTVTAATGGAGLSGATVTLFDTDEDTLETTTTGSGGAYTFPGVPVGTYFLEFDDSSAGYITQYYSGESAEGASDPVTVASGATATANAALATGGEITGTVTDASSSAGLVGAEVYVEDTQGEDIASVFTGAGGTYTVTGLATGTYKIYASDSSGYGYLYYGGALTYGSATSVSVTAPNATGSINVALQPSSDAGSISGTVTAGGQPAYETYVELFDANNNVVEGTNTALDGTYSFTGLPAGSYKVFFAPNGNLAWQFYSNATTLASATAVKVVAGTPTTGVNATLTTGGKVSGTVTDAATKAPVADVDVEVVDSSGYELDGYDTSTNSSGAYTLAGIPTGSWYIEFNPDDHGGTYNSTDQPYAVQYYNNADTLAQATKVSVTAGSTTPSINAALTTTVTQTPATVTVTGPTVTKTVTVVQTPPSITGKVSVSKKAKASLSFTLKAGSNMPDIRSFTVRLPSGLSFNKKKLKKALSVKGAKYSEKLSKGKLVVTLKSGVSSVKVSVGSKGLTVGKALAKKAKSKQTGTLTVHVSSTNVDKKTTNLSFH